MERIFFVYVVFVLLLRTLRRVLIHSYIHSSETYWTSIFSRSSLPQSDFKQLKLFSGVHTSVCISSENLSPNRIGPSSERNRFRLTGGGARRRDGNVRKYNGVWCARYLFSHHRSSSPSDPLRYEIVIFFFFFQRFFTTHIISPIPIRWRRCFRIL